MTLRDRIALLIDAARALLDVHEIRSDAERARVWRALRARRWEELRNALGTVALAAVLLASCQPHCPPPQVTINPACADTAPEAHSRAAQLQPQPTSRRSSSLRKRCLAIWGLASTPLRCQVDHQVPLECHGKDIEANICLRCGIEMAEKERLEHGPKATRCNDVKKWVDAHPCTMSCIPDTDPNANGEVKR